MPSSLVLHIGHAGTPDFPVRLLLNGLAGLLAAVVMNVPMQRLPEGSTPPFVAGAALSGQEPTEVSGTTASALHYVAGVLAGVLFTAVVVVLETPAQFGLLVAGTGLPVVSHLAGGVVVFLVLYAFFAYLVLPRFGGSVRQRAEQVRQDWLVSALVYCVALLVLVPAVTVMFR